MFQRSTHRIFVSIRCVMSMYFRYEYRYRLQLCAVLYFIFFFSSFSSFIFVLLLPILLEFFIFLFFFFGMLFFCSIVHHSTFKTSIYRFYHHCLWFRLRIRFDAFVVIPGYKLSNIIYEKIQYLWAYGGYLVEEKKLSLFQ